MKSGETTRPGFVHDRFSSFYPLAKASRAIRSLDLEAYGLRWAEPEVAVAHPARDGSAAWVVAGDVDAAAASMEAFAPGDGGRVAAAHAPVGSRGGAPADALGPRGMLDFARFGLLPVRRLGTEEFSGEGGPRLLSGNALHADLSPEQPGSGMYGLVLCGLAQNYNFPVVRGGSSGLIRALVRRLEARGGRVTCDARVARVLLRGGRAGAVRTADGREVEAGRAVLADVSAPALFLELVGRDALPGHVLAGLERFEWGNRPSRRTGRCPGRSRGCTPRSRVRGRSTSPRASAPSHGRRWTPSCAGSRPSPSSSRASTRAMTPPGSPRGRRPCGPTPTSRRTSRATRAMTS